MPDQGRRLRLRQSFADSLNWIGRHPLAVLVLPSIWLFARYLPFWKDVDVLDQLIWPFAADNILMCPPVYCVLGRVPFWLVDSVLGQAAPTPLQPQHPSLVAVYALVLIQHAGLWWALRYFLFSVTDQPTVRGGLTILLTSVACFYSFAHTAGAESSIAVTWFILFGATLRLLDQPSSWFTWAIYSAALFFSIGSRHISGVILAFLPVTIGLLALGRWQLPGSFVLFSFRDLARLGLYSVVISAAAFALEQTVVGLLAHHFQVTLRKTLGRGVSARIGRFVDPLPAGHKDRLLAQTLATSSDPDVRMAITSQIRVGIFQNGTQEAIGAVLRQRGLHGEALDVVRDRIILESSYSFFRNGDLGLYRTILADVWRGLYPTNDQGISLTGAKSVVASVERIAQDPKNWLGLSRLPIFDPATSARTLRNAESDLYFRHWRWVPMIVWTLVYFGIGLARLVRRQLPPELFLTATCVWGIGFTAYVATCIFNYSQPRYVFPLTVAIFAAGGIFIAAGKRLNRTRFSEPH